MFVVLQDEAATTVAGWLKSLKLETCLDALNDLGYEDIDLVTDGDDEEVADMIAAVEAVEGIKKPTVKKFKRELAKLRGKGESL